METNCLRPKTPAAWIALALMGLVAASCLYTRHDIHVTLDIRHIQETATDIEDIVSGEKDMEDLDGAAAATQHESWLARLFDVSSTAWADSSLEIKNVTPELRKAIERRKARFEAIRKYKNKKALGENQMALLETRPCALLEDEAEGPKIKQLVKDENADRLAIYKEIARQNGATDAASLAKIQRAWAGVNRSKAEKGDWVQIPADKADYRAFLKSKMGRAIQPQPKPGSWVQAP